MLRNKRRRYPIDHKSRQYRFLAMVLIYNLIIVAFLFICLFLPDLMEMQDKTLSLEIRAAAADKVLTMHARVWPAIFTLICIIGLHSFRGFHRLIGPLHRFRWAFEQVRDGNLNLRVELRKKDSLHQEAKSFNEMIEALAARIKRTKIAGMDALKSQEELEQALEKNGELSQAGKQLLRFHRKHLETLAETTRYFRLRNGEENLSSQGSED